MMPVCKLGAIEELLQEKEKRRKGDFEGHAIWKYFL